MKLEFSGSPEIAAPRDRVWERLMDPEFVARSAPGVESVEAIDPTHFKVISGFGGRLDQGAVRHGRRAVRVVPGRSAKMRVRGKAPGSALDVVIGPRDPGRRPVRSRLNWSATSEIAGTVASVGARLMEGTARKLTEQFWTDFARRVSQEGSSLLAKATLSEELAGYDPAELVGAVLLAPVRLTTKTLRKGTRLSSEAAGSLVAAGRSGDLNQPVRLAWPEPDDWHEDDAAEALAVAAAGTGLKRAAAASEPVGSGRRLGRRAAHSH